MRLVSTILRTMTNFVKLSALCNYALHKTCLINFKRLHRTAAHHSILGYLFYRADQVHMYGEYGY